MKHKKKFASEIWPSSGGCHVLSRTVTKVDLQACVMLKIFSMYILDTFSVQSLIKKYFRSEMGSTGLTFTCKTCLKLQRNSVRGRLLLYWLIRPR